MLLLCLVFTAALVVRAYVCLSDTLSARAKTEIAKRFPGLNVSVGSVEILDSRRIVCRDIVLYESEHLGFSKRTILETEELIVHCPLSISDYLEDNIAIESIELRHPKLHLTRDEQGNIREWTYFPKESKKKLDLSLRIHQGTFSIDDLTVENVNLFVFPETQEETGLIRFQGNAAATWCRAVEFDGSLEPETKQWKIKGGVRELTINRKFWDQRDVHKLCKRFLDQISQSPANSGIKLVSHEGGSVASNQSNKALDLQQLEKILQSVRGRCSMDFELHSDETAPMGVRGNVTGAFGDGRVHFDFFKHPFSDLRLQFRLTGEKLEVRHCAATYGDTKVYLIYTQPQLDHLENAEIYIKTEQMKIDREMIAYLRVFASEKIDQFLATFNSFNVTTDLDLSIRRKNGRWKFHDLSLKAWELNLVYANSLFPIDSLEGTMNLDRNGTLDFEFSTPESEAPIPTYVPVKPGPLAQDSQEMQHYPPVPSTSFMYSLDHPFAVEEEGLHYPELIDGSHEALQNEPLTDEKYIHIQGRFENVPASPYGKLTVRASGVPINSKLINTIPEKQRRVVQSLHPEGKISAFISLLFPKDKNREVKKHFVIGAENCSICYDLFPYPVRGINGIIEWNGEDWRFLNFTGDNESTKVRAEGNMKREAEGLVLFLRINASDLPLEGRLKDALLNQSHREIHGSMRGTGNVNVDSQVFYYPQYKKLFVTFDAEPDKKTGLTICPVNFPLRIENVQGNIHYDNGNITIKGLKGRNKDSRLSSDVSCRFHEDGSWVMDISELIIDQVHSQDPDLLKAMPENLQVLAKTFDLKDPVNIDGAVRLSRSAPGAPLYTQWNATMSLFQNSANLGLPVRNIGGQLHLRGLSENSKLNVSGELDLDSIFVHDIQLLNISGPFHYDGEKVRLGQDVATDDFVFRHTLPGAQSREVYLGQQPAGARRVAVNASPQSREIPHNALSPPRRDRIAAPQQPYVQSQPNPSYNHQILPYTPPEARPITANVFGGTATCRGEVLVRHKNITYNMNLGLENGNMAQAIRELRSGGEKSFGPKERKISGRLDISANINGAGRNPDTLSGEGKVLISDAYLYDTPMMLQVLQVLSIREPDKNAFSKSEIQFRLQGKKMLLNKVKFEGTAFSLEGNGDLQLEGNQRLSLILKTKLGDHKNRIPLFSDVIRGVGKELNDIHIEGPLSNPEIVTNPLPRVRDALEQFKGKP